MGKATIVGGGADGLYTIEIDSGSDVAEKRIADIDAELPRINESINNHTNTLNELLPMLDAQAAILNALINAYELALLQTKDETYTALTPPSLTQAMQENKNTLQAMSEAINNSHTPPLPLTPQPTEGPTEGPTIKTLAQDAVDLAQTALTDAENQQKIIQDNPMATYDELVAAQKIVDVAKKNLTEARESLDSVLELKTELKDGELWKLINCCC